MKKVLLSIAVGAAFVSAYAQHNTSLPQERYDISGTCSSDAKWVYIIDPAARNAKVDSVEVTGGKFKISGTDAKNNFLGITDNGPVFLPFLNDGTAITADLTSYTLNGSEFNTRLGRYDHELTVIIGRQKDLVSPIMEAQKSGISEDSLRSMLDAVMPQLESIEAEQESCLRRIITENSDNLIPAFYASQVMYMFDYNELTELYSSDKVYSSHPMTKRLHAFIEKEKIKNESIGKPFKDIEESDTAGVSHKLSEYCGKGNYVLIDFWASWCGPCMQEMPNVKANYEKYKSKGFNVVGLSFDRSKERWINCINENELNWTHLSDLKFWQTIAASTYGISSIPSSLLIDPNGIVIARDLRGKSLGEKLSEIYGF